MRHVDTGDEQDEAGDGKQNEKGRRSALRHRGAEGRHLDGGVGDGRSRNKAIISAVLWA